MKDVRTYDMFYLNYQNALKMANLFPTLPDYLIWTRIWTGQSPESLFNVTYHLDNKPIVICHVTFSRPLIGQKWECYIVEEVIDVDELNEGNIHAAAEARLTKVVSYD